MKRLLLLIVILLFTGCNDVLIKEKNIIDATHLEPANSFAMRADKTKPLIYDGALPDEKYENVIKYPVINLKTEYGNNANQLIQMLLTRAFKRYDKDSEDIILEYKLFDNESFYSVLLTLNKQEGEERLCFNFYKENGEGLTVDDLDNESNFEGFLKSSTEETAVEIYKDKPDNKRISRTLSEFWNMQDKKFPQIYLEKGVPVGIFSIYDKKGEKFSALIPIIKNSDSQSAINPAFIKFNGKGNSEFIVAKIKDKEKDKKGMEIVVKNALKNEGFTEEIPIIGKETKDSETYLIIPKYKYSIIRYYPEKESPGQVILSPYYLIRLSEKEKSPELIFRSDIFVLSGLKEDKFRVFDISEIFN